MRTRLLNFVDALRDAGVPVTLAETLDAMGAVRVGGIEPGVFRESLAATLVKDEADRPAFDTLFDRFFAVPKRARGAASQPRTREDGEGHGRGRSGPGRQPAADSESHRPAPTAPQRTERRAPAPRPQDRTADQAGQQLRRARALQRISFHDMLPRDVDACSVLAAALAQRLRAHLRRRRRDAARGRVDLRRTMRRSTQTAGVPVSLAFRRRRPGRPDLVVLCDASHSVAAASNFLLALIAPARDFFRRVRLFAFVDRPVEVSIESGTVVPHDRLDLYARSDFGSVLAAMWEQHRSLLTRSTILLILGDARNNRRPPRGDILGRIHGEVRRVVWLNPEPQARWNTADSVMRGYARHCDAVLCAANVRDLNAAVRRNLSTA